MHEEKDDLKRMEEKLSEEAKKFMGRLSRTSLPPKSTLPCSTPIITKKPRK